MTGEDPIAKAAYDELADTYAAEVDTNPYNVHLDLPGTTSLIPDVEGTRVLDAGCGTGLYTAWLLEQGADVVGVDVSEAMLDHAVDRVGDRAEFHCADLGEPLSFAAENEFDGIVSGLALGYIKDWEPTFMEFARILAPEGFLVFSVAHPVDEFPLDEDETYFATERRTKEWAVDVPYYRRPLSAMVTPLLAAGFSIDAITEPQPTAAFEDAWPERYATESRHPVFLAIRAVNRTNGAEPARVYDPP